MIAGELLTNVIAVSAGNHLSSALKADGTVVQWGFDVTRHSPIEPFFLSQTNGPVRLGGSEISNVVALATGEGFALALRQDGTELGWGKSPAPDGLSNVVAISAYSFAGLAINSDGTAVIWDTATGDENRGKLFQIPDWTNVVAVAMGGGLNSTRILALKNDGTVATLGNRVVDGSDQPPMKLTNITAVATGASFSLVLRQDGTVFGWGDNTYGQTTGVASKGSSSGVVTINGQILTNVVSIAARDDCGFAIKADGTIVKWGMETRGLTPPSGLTGVVALALGNNYCLAITTNRSVAEVFRKK